MSDRTAMLEEINRMLGDILRIIVSTLSETVRLAEQNNEINESAELAKAFLLKHCELIARLEKSA